MTVFTRNSIVWFLFESLSALGLSICTETQWCATTVCGVCQ